MLRASAILREAAVTAANQKLSSALTVAVVAALCATVLLTAGRTEGSAAAVLSSLDASGTRSIVVRAQAGSGLDTRVLRRLAGVGGIEWAGAFGFSDDVTNSAVPGGARVSLRKVFTEASPDADADADADACAGAAAGTDSARGSAAPDGLLPQAVASFDAASELGFSEGVGTVVSSDSGLSYDVASVGQLPSDLRFLEPVVLLPQPVAWRSSVPLLGDPPCSARGVGTSTVRPAPDSPSADAALIGGSAGEGVAEPVAIVVVRASSPGVVVAVAAIVASVLGVDDPSKITVQTSERLAAVRGQVAGELGEFGRALVLSVFGGSSALVAAILFSLVMMRRRDFGRRRALGASRSLIVTLLLTQVGMIAALASATGTLIALLTLALTAQPLPSATFTSAVAVLGMLTSVAAALVPAAVASTRDPLRELRVP